MSEETMGSIDAIGEMPGSSQTIPGDQELDEKQLAVIASMVQGEGDGEETGDDAEPNPEKERRNSWFLEENSKLPIIIIGQDNIEIRPEDIIIAPDGGWGWFVVFAAFMSNLIVDGTCNSSGILLLSIVTSEEKTLMSRITKSDVSWILGLVLGFALLSGPFVSLVANKIGFRWTAIAGSALSSLAFIIAYIVSRNEVPNVPTLFICYGVLAGIGFGFIYVPSIVIVGFYFQKKRALATGISVCGSGVGTFVYPPVTKVLIGSIGWPQTILVLGLVLAASIGLGAIYRPLKSPALKDAIKARNERRVSSLIDLTRTASSAHILSQNRRASASSGSRRPVSPGSDEQLPEVGSNETVTDYVPSERPFETSGMFTLPGSKSDEEFVASLAPPLKREDSGPSMLAKLPIFGQVGFKRAPTVKRFSTDSGLRQRIASMTMTVNELLMSESDSGSDFARHVSVSSAGNRKVLRLTNTAYNEDPNAEAPKTILLLIDEDNSDFNQSRVFKVNANLDNLNNPFHQSGIFYGGDFANVPDFQETEDGIAWEAVPVAEDVAAELVAGEPRKKMKCRIECGIVKKMLDVSLLQSPTFLLLATSGATMLLGYFIPFLYLTELVEAINENGEQKFQMASLLISIIGITNTIGRIVVGATADRLGKHVVLLSNMALVIAGLLTAAVPYMTISYAVLVTYAGVFGLCVACVISLRSIILVQFLGLNKLTNAFGLTLLFQGVCALAGSPLAGFLRQLKGNYNLTFYFAGAVMALAGLVCLPINFVHSWEVKKTQARAAAVKRNSTSA